jgi:hypothetical protein
MERGWSSPGDTYVCDRCVDDYALRRLIREQAQSLQCDYCTRRARKNPIAAPIDDLFEAIADGLATEWGDPNEEGVAWDSGEGGWQGDVIDTYDLANDEISDLFVSDALKEEFINSFFDRQWCQRDFYGVPPDKELEYGWRAFVEHVQHRGRYLFMVRRSQPDEGWPFKNDIEPRDMLAELGRIIVDLNLIRELPAGTRIYRARQHRVQQVVTNARQLGPPPPERAQANRMSAPGIPMFYGALDRGTAITEIFNPRKRKPYAITSGEFQTARPIHVVDLSKRLPVPSMFDAARRDQRGPTLFLRGFVREVSRPLDRDGSEHIEYVPTQIVTEYLRDLLEDEEERAIQGMLFGSSKSRNGVCAVLFFEEGACFDLEDGWEDNERAWLALDPASITTEVTKA